MLYKVVGMPISIVRYVLNWQKNKITSLEYRTSDKDFKITSSIDSKTDRVTVNLQGIKDGAIIDFPIGGATFFKLDDYKNTFKNKANNNKFHTIPALNIIKNTSENIIKQIDIPFGDYEMQIPLRPNCNAVFYQDHVSIFNRFGREIAKYYVFDDGIYEITDELANFTYISKDDGRSSGFFSVDNFDDHSEVMPSLNVITPISKEPMRILDETNMYLNIAYDTYGLMKRIDEGRDLECHYTDEYETKDGLRIRESAHHLIYDNFDLSQHYYNTRKGVAESVKINDMDHELEYIRVIYDNVQQIKETNQYEFREQADFYKTVENCFKY